MAHETDYVPRSDAEFNGWLKNIILYVGPKVNGSSPQWAFIPRERYVELGQAATAWVSAYEKTLGAHTSVDTEEKNEQRHRVEKCARAFIQQFLKFDPVTNEDRTAMNIPNHDDIRTAIGVPGTRPVIGELKSPGGFRVEIPFADEASPTSRQKPYGCNGCLLFYALAAEKTQDYEQLAKTKLMTHTPFMLQLEPSAEGQYLSVACRWQNETGQVGPWSEIHHIAVS